MANKLYVAGTEPRSGKSAIILGLMELLTRNIKKVAFFKPLIEEDYSRVGKLRRDNTIKSYQAPLSSVCGLSGDVCLHGHRGQSAHCLG